MEALQEFVDNFTYLGIFAVLLLGSLGVPIPEEMSIIAAAVLSHASIVRWWLALPICLLGVLSGDMVLYWVGRHWGEQVLNWRLVRLVLSPAREQWLKAAYRRHALKTVVTARHVMGLRAAAFLTAGRANVPFWKFVVADTGAALFGVVRVRPLLGENQTNSTISTAPTSAGSAISGPLVPVSRRSALRALLASSLALR